MILRTSYVLTAVFWLTALPGWAAPDKITAVDADDHSVVLNEPGRITVILSSGEDTQDQTRAASKSLDEFKGRSNFRLIVVTDLRDSLAGLVPSYVKKRMRQDLDKEAVRIVPFYRANGSTRNPRSDLCAVADYTGAVCVPLGQPKPRDTLWVVIFGRDGHIQKRWNNLKDYAELHREAGRLLAEKTAP